jgi:hypothetical protein
LTPDGLIWSEAQIVSITNERVNVRRNGQRASLHRESLREGVTWWRGVRYMSARDGLSATLIEFFWEWQCGWGRPAKGSWMPLHEACALLKVRQPCTRQEVIAAFRRQAKRSHPDMGGADEQFARVIIARDRLLASIARRLDRIERRLDLVYESAGPG